MRVLERRERLAAERGVRARRDQVDAAGRGQTGGALLDPRGEREEDGDEAGGKADPERRERRTPRTPSDAVEGVPHGRDVAPRLSDGRAELAERRLVGGRDVVLVDRLFRDGPNLDPGRIRERRELGRE